MTFRRLGLIVVTINYLAAAALIPARAVAGDAQADLVDFKYRADKAGGSSLTLRTVGTIINKSAGHLAGAICIRLYDEHGFELKTSRGDDVSLAPGQSVAVIANKDIKLGEWAQVASLKAYLGRFGCVTSPGQGLSPVVEVKIQNGSK